MGRRRHPAGKTAEPAQSSNITTATDQNEASVTTEAEVQIIAEESHIMLWSKYMSTDEQVKVLLVTEKNLMTESSLLGLDVVSPWTFDPGLVARMIRVFVHALEEREGKVDVEMAEAEFAPQDRPVLWIVVGLLQRRLNEFQIMRCFWTQLFWGLFYKLGVMWMPVLAVACFAEYKKLGNLRSVVYEKVAIFFDDQILSVGFAPLLLLGPFCAGGLVGWLGVGAGAVAVTTAWSITSSQIRYANKLSVLAGILFNIVLVVSAFWQHGIWHGLAITAIFNWGLLVALGGFLLIGCVIGGAFLKDVIVGLIPWKTPVRTALAVVTYMLWQWETGRIVRLILWLLWSLTAVTMVASCIIVEKHKEKLALVAAFLMATVQYLLMLAHTVYVTLVIYCSSLPLGWQWTMYLCSRRNNSSRCI